MYIFNNLYKKTFFLLQVERYCSRILYNNILSRHNNLTV